MTEDQTPKKRRSWTKIVMVVSLALNLLIVGAVVGALSKFDRGGWMPLDRASMGLGLFIAALPDEKRSVVHQAAGPISNDRRAFFKDMKQRRKQLETAILKEPFSEERVRDAVREHRDFALGATIKLQDTFVNVLSEMSPEQRIDYFARVEELRKSRKERRKLRHRKHN